MTDGIIGTDVVVKHLRQSLQRDIEAAQRLIWKQNHKADKVKKQKRKAIAIAKRKNRNTKRKRS